MLTQKCAAVPRPDYRGSLVVVRNTIERGSPDKIADPVKLYQSFSRVEQATKLSLLYFDDDFSEGTASKIQWRFW